MQDFPVTARYAYLNTAAVGTIPQSTVEQMTAFYQRHTELGSLARLSWMDEIEQVRRRVADYINAHPDEIAMVPHTAAAARMLAQTLQGQGKILVCEADYPTINSPWELSGYDLQYWHSEPNGALDLQAVADSDATAVCISHVQWTSGYRLDLARLSDVCRRTGKQLFVDGTQSLGPQRIDVQATPMDCLMVSGYKWMMAGFGASFMYLSRGFLERYPIEIHYRFYDQGGPLEPTARRYEIGHERFDAVRRLGAGLGALHTYGYDRVVARTAELTDYLYRQLAAHGIRILSDYDAAHRSQIVSIAGDEALRQQLEERGIIVSQRGPGLRVAVYYYNTEADIDRLIEGYKACTSARLL